MPPSPSVHVFGSNVSRPPLTTTGDDFSGASPARPSKPTGPAATKATKAQTPISRITPLLRPTGRIGNRPRHLPLDERRADSVWNDCPDRRTFDRLFVPSTNGQDRTPSRDKVELLVSGDERRRPAPS